MTYTLNIPDAPNNPSTDQPLMKDNTNAINALIDVDHVKFNQGASTGWHKVIHQTTQSGNPGTVSGINQIYAKNYAPNATNGVTDTQLFTKTGTGEVFQVTGFVITTDNGYCWLGGALIQWGKVTFTASENQDTGDVTFKDRDSGKLMIPFPNTCNHVTCTLNYKVASPSLLATLAVKNFTKNKFTWFFNSNGTSGIKGTDQYDAFYWVAIGN